MKVWVNTIVNNEENFLWFAVTSIIDYVDKVLIWDTGSTDKTVQIAKDLQVKYKSKILFKEIGKVNAKKFPQIRQKMIEQSDCDWILILDGDEIWWKNSIKKIISKIKENSNKAEGIVVPMIVPVGDIFHIQEEKAGQYYILGRTGHLSLKAFSKKIPGLHVSWPYGKEGFFDNENRLIQQRENMIFLDTPFLHVTHLERSTLSREYNKFKYEIGKKVDKDFKFPEVLYKDYPSYIHSPWGKIGGLKKITASFLSPFRKIKRRII